ncbi:hypothetical protein [Maricaulis sp.]|uniref:hypothetical protein n=1 Tax=Maricaulis sp. TaxID=1486257 RepID=UPI003297F8BC
MSDDKIPALTGARIIHKWKGHDGGVHELVRLETGALACLLRDNAGAVKDADSLRPGGDMVAMAQRILAEPAPDPTIAEIKALAMTVIAAECEREG